MASMEDLIATINGGMHAGQKGNDLKDLHATLAQTLHPIQAPYRPIPPPATTTAQLGGGPTPPPAPASSWNSPPPISTQNHIYSSPANGGWASKSPRQGAFAQEYVHGTVPPPAPSGSIPYHAAVLPVKASPKDTGGFADDAFRPLWTNGSASKGNEWKGFGGKH